MGEKRKRSDRVSVMIIALYSAGAAPVAVVAGRCLFNSWNEGMAVGAEGSFSLGCFEFSKTTAATLSDRVGPTALGPSLRSGFLVLYKSALVVALLGGSGFGWFTGATGIVTGADFRDGKGVTTGKVEGDGGVVEGRSRRARSASKSCA